jgi:hypothetical protein
MHTYTVYIYICAYKLSIYYGLQYLSPRGRRGRRGRWFFPVRTLVPCGRSLFSARGGGRTGSTGARNDLGWDDELQGDDLGSSCLI